MPPSRQKRAPLTVLEQLAQIEKQQADLAQKARELVDTRAREIGERFKAAKLLHLTDAQLSQVIEFAQQLEMQTGK